MYVQRKSLVSAFCACTVFLSFTCGVLLDCERISAADLDPSFVAQQANEYKQQIEQGLVTIEEAVLTDIQNGNLDQTSALGQQYLTGIAIQTACIYLPGFQTVFHAADLALQGIPTDLFDNPSEISVSGSGTIGMYLDNNSNLQFANFYKPSDGQLKDPVVICSSPDFIFTLSSDNPINVTGLLNNNFCGISYWLSYGYSGYSHRDCTGTISGTVQEVTYGGSYVNGFGVSITSGSFFPRLSDMNPNSAFVTVAKYGSNLTLPIGTIDSDKPYEYYNNYVLPYIEQNLPDFPEEYIIFPDGWTPGQLPTDPPEPTSPTGDFILPPYGELMTEPSSWFVTDESGETITDESGEPVTETTMIPVTVASSEEGRYVFRIPTLPNLEVPAETPELALSLPQKLVGLSAALFRGVYEILDSSGVLTILPFLVAVAVAIYVIYHLGG